jgi:hypothetical protein
MSKYNLDKEKNGDAMKLLVAQMHRKFEAIALGGGQKEDR